MADYELISYNGQRQVYTIEYYGLDLLNTDKVIDYYRQISQQELIQLFYDTMKLQKDYINAFQPQWAQLMKTNVETYLAFQNKMMFLYLQNCNIYFKNISDMKIIEQKKGEGEKDQKILL